MSTQTAESNGTVKPPNKLDELHAAWVKNGSKKPQAAENKKLVADYLKADKEVEIAHKAVAEALAKRSAIVEQMILANGKGQLRFNGEIHIPMSRGETVFFRGPGGGDVKDIG